MKEMLSIIYRLFVSVICWILVAPIAFLCPKRADWVAVIGRQDGRFLDNAKYFFIQAPSAAPELRIVFVTERPDVFQFLTGRSRETLLYPTAKSVWFLLRCGTVVVDEAAWFRKARFFLLIRSRVVQLWHGVPFKWIELGLWRNPTGKFSWTSNRWVLWFRHLIYRLTGRYMRYSVVISTSKFYRDNVFSKAFSSHYFLVTGYPRNDFALSLSEEDAKLAWDGVDTAIKGMLSDWEKLGRKLVLIAPTFRDSGSLPMSLTPNVFLLLDKFAEYHGVEFIFKFHPMEQNVSQIEGAHIHVCSRDSDIYPLLPYVSALVTDYSSISMDFLFVDRPLLFFIPEDDDYVTKDRKLQFDPRDMMPGPVLHDWESVLSSLLLEWEHDGYRKERAGIRRKAFDDLPQSEAVLKLLEFMREKHWLPAPEQG